MKKMLAALLAAVLTLCFAAALAEDTGLADVKVKGTLVMGFDEVGATTFGRLYITA